MEAVEKSLAAIRTKDKAINAFTAVLEDRAMATAKKKLDGPLAGIPFAVKNLFDVKGISTLAGSKINRDLPPATRDSPLIEKLEAAGAGRGGGPHKDQDAYRL